MTSQGDSGRRKRQFSSQESPLVMREKHSQSPLAIALPVVSLIVVLFWTAVVGASPITVIDQENTATTGSVGVNTNSGQTFTPALGAIDAAEYQLKSDAALSVSINLREDSLSGTLLGSTNQVAIPGDNTFRIAHFDFDSQVSLTPGNVYFLQIVQQGTGNLNAAFDSSGGYTSGAYLGGGVSPFFDVWFREGLHVPEPPAVILAAMGFFGLAAFGCRRRKR